MKINGFPPHPSRASYHPSSRFLNRYFKKSTRLGQNTHTRSDPTHLPLLLRLNHPSCLCFHPFHQQITEYHRSNFRLKTLMTTTLVDLRPVSMPSLAIKLYPQSKKKPSYNRSYQRKTRAYQPTLCNSTFAFTSSSLASAPVGMQVASQFNSLTLFLCPRPSAAP
jgi:hypothetical protein